MYGYIVRDDRGAVATDWVALTAGIVVLGIVVMYGVMGNSQILLQNTFDTVNAEVEARAVEAATLGKDININK
ncbi:MAG: pilus assembly protein [Proteobacteria bacterium]|nr:pilus assembly protein [Pseudomonadota bacterium]